MSTPPNLARPRFLRRVFVWELPVRVYHWINALCLVSLIGTGLIIGDPPAILSSNDASASYWFGTVRFIHYASAYIFCFNFAFRIYWGFVGNRYADWKNFIPTSRQYFKDIWIVLKTDIFMTVKPTHHAIGHNRMAAFTYFFTFLAFVLQCLTGFGLYSAMSDWWFPRLFKWVPSFLGSDLLVREIHHWTTWFFILFIVIHVYLVFFHDYIEGSGEMSSMAGGYKFVDEETFNQANKEEIKEKKEKKDGKNKKAAANLE